MSMLVQIADEILPQLYANDSIQILSLVQRVLNVRNQANLKRDLYGIIRA